MFIFNKQLVCIYFENKKDIIINILIIKNLIMSIMRETSKSIFLKK